MKWALQISRRQHIFSMLESSLTGLAITFVVISISAVVRSGLLVLE